MTREISEATRARFAAMGAVGDRIIRAEVFAAIEAERVRQSIRWSPPHAWGQGDCSSSNVKSIVKVAVLTEEVGEVARAVLEHDEEQLRAELIQVAAVAVAWLEALWEPASEGVRR